MGALCVSNNPLWGEKPEAFRFIEGSAEAVFEAARDLVHLGWRFAAHPLYGNFNPLRHPYRTLVLLEPAGTSAKKPDMESLALLELALEACRNGKRDIERPRELPESIKADFAQLDRTLMKETVEEHTGGKGIASPGRAPRF